MINDSSMVDAIEEEERICPEKFRREALEIAIGLRESHRQGNGQVDLPLVNRELRMGQAVPKASV